MNQIAKGCIALELNFPKSLKDYRETWKFGGLCWACHAVLDTASSKVLLPNLYSRKHSK